MGKQVKSRQRVADHGEVFTAEREVNAMLDLVKPETQRVDSRFLEPACGDGNFLAEILRRKLEAAKRAAVPPKRKKPLPAEFERQSVLAMASIYGVDILEDNVLVCRERLYEIWDKEYTAICKNEVNEDCRKSVRFILSRNIVCGNALSMRQVDGEGNDTEEPIVFSEWTFVMGSKMQRKDFRFDKLLSGDYEPKLKTDNTSQLKTPEEEYQQMELFGTAEEQPSDEGEFLTSYITDYRRIWKIE